MHLRYVFLEHALLQERRLYDSSLGWNIPYAPRRFNESDMLISLQQLFAFLEENEETPFKASSIVSGSATTAGRVTDGKDRITLNSIMERFFNSIKMSDSGTYSNRSYNQSKVGDRATRCPIGGTYMNLNFL